MNWATLKSLDLGSKAPSMAPLAVPVCWAADTARSCGTAGCCGSTAACRGCWWHSAASSQTDPKPCSILRPSSSPVSHCASGTGPAPKNPSAIEKDNIWQWYVSRSRCSLFWTAKSRLRQNCLVEVNTMLQRTLIKENKKQAMQQFLTKIE